MAERKRASTRKKREPAARKRKAPPPFIAPLPPPKAEVPSAEESKFYTGPVVQKFQAEKRFELPQGYGDNKIILLVRDPHWIYAYWEISQKRRDEIRAEAGEELFRSSRESLRVYSVGNWEYFDIEVTGGARNWYIHVPSPNRAYCVDIGYRLADGRFIAAARSNIVTTPPDRMSDTIDEEWMIPDWEKLYSLSGGWGIGRSSAEIRELMQKRLKEEAASGWVSSFSSPSGRVAERPFSLWAEAELILYGATEPSATLTVQGRKVHMRPDGTFSLRFSFPDDQHVFPIEAVRDDGAERRKIVIKAERKTEA